MTVIYVTCIHVIYRMGGPYWKNILSRSQKRPSAIGMLRCCNLVVMILLFEGKRAF